MGCSMGGSTLGSTPESENDISRVGVNLSKVRLTKPLGTYDGKKVNNGGIFYGEIVHLEVNRATCTHIYIFLIT